MAEPVILAPLFDALRDLVTWFRNDKVNGIIIGGVAASLLGRPRATRDIDALVRLDEEKWPEFLEQCEKYGFVPRISEPLPFASKSRVLLLKHFLSGIDIDIAFAGLPFEEDSILKATAFNIKGLALRLPRPEDLIIMKAVAARPKDLVDIESLIDANPNLDHQSVTATVKEFAEALDMPELSENLHKILSKKIKK
jgi:hypothetical protein